MHAYASTGHRMRPLAVLAALAVAVAIGAHAVFDRLDLGPAWLISSPTVGVAFGALYLILDRFAWRWRPLRAVGLIDVPVIEGTYEGILRSKYDDVDRAARIVIEQTWTRLAVRMEMLGSTTSTSSSTSAAVDATGRSRAAVTFTYRNLVRPAHADEDMADHDGAAEVTIDAEGKLSGRYFNFRGHQGTLDLERM